MSRFGFRFFDEKDVEIGCKDLSQEVVDREEEDETEEYHQEIDDWIEHVVSTPATLPR